MTRKRIEREARRYAEAFEAHGVAEASFIRGAEFGYNEAKKEFGKQIEKMKHTEQNVMDKLWEEWDITLGVSN